MSTQLEYSPYHFDIACTHKNHLTSNFYMYLITKNLQDSKSLLILLSQRYAVFYQRLRQILHYRQHCQQ